MNQGRQMTAREIDSLSTVLIDAGWSFVKRNPIPVGAYMLGALICFSFTGFASPPEKIAEFERKVAQIDHQLYDVAALNLAKADEEYRRSKGWFTCDKYCQHNKANLLQAQQEFELVRRSVEKQQRDAKSTLGIFSSYGVGETRDLFWLRFSQGKGFATRQSTMHALFMGIRAMSRDESFLEYFLRLFLNILFNFTLGMFGAVVAFIYGLFGLIATYQVPLYYGLLFFIMATLAALSFAVTWLLAIYAAAAGTVYAGAKLLAANLRVEGTSGGQSNYNQRVHGGNRSYRD